MEYTLTVPGNPYARGARKVTVLIDRLVTLLLVLCPILQHYQGLYLEVSSEVLILLAPYVLLKLLAKRRLRYQAVIPLVIYALYISFIHGVQISIFFREILLLLYFFAVINGCVDADRYFRCAKAVALCASCCIFIQYIFYYSFQTHLQLVHTGNFTESAQQWKGLVETGLVSVSGKPLSFYRPSGFFLEPSHISIYCIPVLCILLLRKDMSLRLFVQALVVSLGVLLSTSGIGIFFVVGVWLLYLVRYYGRRSGRPRKFRRVNRAAVVFLVAILVLGITLYFSVDFLQSAVNRVFISSGEDKTAIGGRTSTGITLLQRLSGWEILFGEGTTYDITAWNISGFFYVTYQFGVIGCLLLNLFYIQSLFKVKDGYFWLSVLVMALSPFTVHTFAAFYRMFYVCCIMGGYPRDAAAEMVPELHYPEPEQGPLVKLRS